MARTSNFANVATVTRASTKTDAGGWDFTNGGTVGTLTEYASGVAAIHPTAGLLVEESTTNEIRNPRCEGAVAGVLGSGGSLPTNWTVFENTGVTITIDGTGADDEGEYLQISFSGTADFKVCEIRYEGTAQTAAASGETWTVSHGFKVTAGDDTGVSSFRQRVVSWSGGSVVEQFSSTESLPSGNAVERRFYTQTLSTACNYVTGGFRVDFAASGTVSFTIRVYIPQMEEKAYPTSPVLPVAASPAVTTRASDDVEIPNGAWSNDNAAGTLYVEAVLNCTGVSGNFGTIGASYGADVANDYIRFRAAGSGSFNVVAEDGNTVVVSTIGTQTISGPAHAVYGAIAWDTNDVVASLRGETQTYDTSATVGFGAAKLIASSGSGSTTFPSQYIKDLRYWPKRLTNAELEALVGN